MTFSKIMVAFDLSDYADEALKYALEFAAALKAELIVANVINQRDVEAVRRVEFECPSLNVEKYIDGQKESRSDRIDEIIRQTSNKGVAVRKIFRIGVPFIELVQAIKDEGADLMIMGKKGRSNIAGVLFGTTAEKLFRRCPVPLLSIRK